MPSPKAKSPQEKKRLSMERDRRNTYGQNDKASRTGIRNRKRRVNRTYRRAANQVLSHVNHDADDLGSKVKAVHREDWKKSPDTPLGELLLETANRKLQIKIQEFATNDPRFLTRLQTWLQDTCLSAVEVREVMRRIKTVAMDRWVAPLNLGTAQLNLIRDFLKR